MRVTIKLMGPLRIDRFKEERREYPVGIKVREIVEGLQFPAHLLGIILINGVHAGVDHRLNDGDILTLLPVLGGG